MTVRLAIGLLVAGAMWMGAGYVAGQDSLDRLEEGLEAPTPPPPPVPRGQELPRGPQDGYLGLTIDLLQADGKTVFIKSVEEGGPAALGGLRPRDVLREINGVTIKGLEDVKRVVRQPPGTNLSIQVRRDGALYRYEITVGTRPSETTTDDAAPFDELPPPTLSEPAPPIVEREMPPTEPDGALPPASRPTLGVTVTSVTRLDANLKRRMGVSVDTGALIRSISEGSAAARAGLPIGGVVVSIDGHRIGDAQDIVDLVKTFQPGQNIEVTYWEGDRMGRKSMNVGSTGQVIVQPAAPLASGDGDPKRDVANGNIRDALRSRLRQRAGDRPLLDAVERLLDDVMPRVPDASPALPAPGIAPTPPPPPPPPRPRSGDLVDDTAEMPAPAELPIDAALQPPEITLPPATGRVEQSQGNDTDVEQLRKEIIQMQQQLDALLLRLEKIEQESVPKESVPKETSDEPIRR